MDGDEVGARLGADEGSNDGLLLGDAEGELDGTLVDGLAAGWPVGGDSDGADSGDKVGASGRNVGTFVAVEDGECVSFTVGACVEGELECGCSNGDLVTRADVGE